MPDKEESTSRRKFLKSTGMVTGGVIGGSLLGGLLTNQITMETDPKEKNENTNNYREARMFFKRFEDFIVLEQATERIYPEDDNGPGAIKLGIPYFIDKQLAGPWGMNARDYRHDPFGGSDDNSVVQSTLTRGDLFIKSLRRMNEISKDRFDTTFDEAKEEQQIEILVDFENDEIDIKGAGSGSFFQLFRMTVLEGAYSDPLYGGNRNMQGWKMKEYPGSVSSYIDKIESEDFIKMDPISLTNYQQKS